MMRYYVDKPDTTYMRIRLSMRKNEAEKFQQLVFVNYKLDEFWFLLEVDNYVLKTALLNQSFWIIVFFKFCIESFPKKTEVKMSWHIGNHEITSVWS